MHPITVLLTLWQAGWLSEQEASAWVNYELARAEVAPPELIDLAYYGLARCTRMSNASFPYRALVLDYRDALTLWAFRLLPDDVAELRRFANWAAATSIGGELDDELVKFGYQLDHLIRDCDDEARALAYARANLPLLKPHYSELAYELLALVPDCARQGPQWVSNPAALRPGPR